MEKAYENILNKNKDQTQAKILLSIIVVATRPLKIEEMDVALNLVLQDNVSSHEELDLDGDNLETRIRNLLRPFYIYF